MVISNKLLFLFLFVFSSFIGLGQDSTVVRDFELWTGVTIKKSFLEDRLDLGLTEEFRFKDNAGTINNFFTELEVGYTIFKGLGAGIGYRYIRNNTKSGYQTMNRLYADVNYKHKIERLQLSYRFRFQNQDEMGVTRNEGDFPVTKYRLRVKAQYNIKKWKLDPYLSAEIFYVHTNNQINYIESITENAYPVNAFEKMRFTLGTDYKIKKWLEIGAFYRIEQELKSYPLFYNTPATYYIAGLNLTFKL